MRRLAAAAVLVALIVALGAGFRRPSAPNILVIVIDTLRADHVGWVNGDRELTPFLDTLAARAGVFARAYSPSSWTGPAVASLLTSRYQSQHGISSVFAVLAERERTLPEILRKHGWATGGFSANPLLTAEQGFGQGFDRYDFRPAEGSGMWMRKERGEDLNEKALAWLDGLPAGSPAFLYLQYMEPHFPYTPPEELKWKTLGRRGNPWDLLRTLGAMLRDPQRWKKPDPEGLVVMEALYEAEIMALDARLRELFAALDARGFLRNAIVVITSDHGEELGDHGDLGHGKTLYEEVVRIPLLVLVPGQMLRVDVQDVVSLVDIAPTILDLAGILRPAQHEGRSLARLVQPPSLVRRATNAIEWLAGHRGPTTRAAYTELVSDSSGKPIAHHHATILGSCKVIGRADGTNESYDLAVDPGEKTTAGLAPAALAEVDTATHELARRALRDPSPYYAVTPDANTTARLRALGYAN
ncbi:MAG TPA: sulfatase [Candidatus Binatia bacterium]|nr:sulfatase [Candidatus Binatia bacterium]